VLKGSTSEEMLPDEAFVTEEIRIARKERPKKRDDILPLRFKLPIRVLLLQIFRC
jgi:hypothetical protein